MGIYGGVARIIAASGVFFLRADIENGVWIYFPVGLLPGRSRYRNGFCV